MPELKLYLPRVVGVGVDEDKRRINPDDYIYSVKVDTHPEVRRDPKQWNAYDPKEW